MAEPYFRAIKLGYIARIRDCRLKFPGGDGLQEQAASVRTMSLVSRSGISPRACQA
jgi:hypothetical protein